MQRYGTFMKKIGTNFKKTSRHTDTILQQIDILIDILVPSKSRCRQDADKIPTSYRHHTDMSASCRDVNGMLSVCCVFEKRPNVQYSNTLQIHVGMSGCFLQNSLQFFMLLVLIHLVLLWLNRTLHLPGGGKYLSRRSNDLHNYPYIHPLFLSRN